MRRLASIALASAFVVAGAIGNASAADLKAGDKAPAFELPGSDGKKHKLSDFAGKQVVVLAWFPKAFTGG